MIEDFPGLEIEKFFVACILQHQSLFPVTDDDPIALPDFQLVHEIDPPCPRPTVAQRDAGALINAERVIQLLAESSRRAMTCAWISAAPSKIDRMRASQRIRETGNSSAKPLPPWICTALSALAQAMRAASSFAIPASRSHRLPESFCRAAK